MYIRNRYVCRIGRPCIGLIAIRMMLNLALGLNGYGSNLELKKDMTNSN